MGSDAADVRGRAEPRRRDRACCSRAAPTRRSRRRRSTSPSRARMDRAATERQKKVLEAAGAEGAAADAEPGAGRRSMRRASCTRRARFRRPNEEGSRGGRRTPPSAGEQFRPRRDQPAGRQQGRPDGAAARGAAGPSSTRRGRCSTAAPPIDQVGAGDATSPLLMAVINGQFDMAMFLIERGANPNLAARRQRRSRRSGPPINTQWQPRTRFRSRSRWRSSRRPTSMSRRRCSTPGADPNARLTSHPWYLVYSGCGNRNCGLADTSGSTAFWRAAYATDLEAMRLLAAYGADPNIQTIAPQQAIRRGPPPGAPAGTAASVPGAGGPTAPVPTATQERFTARSPVAARRPGRARDPRRRPASNTAKASPATPIVMRPTRGWPSVKYLVEELGADVNARDNDGYTPLHHARRARRQRADHVSRVEGRRRDRRGAQRPDDRGHGQRSGAARLADPGDGGAAREARIEEQPPLRLLPATTFNSPRRSTQNSQNSQQGICPACSAVSALIVVISAASRAGDPRPFDPPGLHRHPGFGIVDGGSLAGKLSAIVSSSAALADALLFFRRVVVIAVAHEVRLSSPRGVAAVFAFAAVACHASVIASPTVGFVGRRAAPRSCSPAVPRRRSPA